MNRDIKFRAWHKKRKILILIDDFCLIVNKNFYTDTYYPKALYRGLKQELHDSSELELMQYTGRHDKNGVEIYEGDILKHSWKPIGRTEPFVHLYKVVFDDGAFQQYEPGDAEDAFSVWKNWEECEVIGNIYENPELLK